MSHLVFEIVLRLAKAGAATIVGTLVYGLAVGALAATPTVELALVCWLVGAAFILLVESSPF